MELLDRVSSPGCVDEDELLIGVGGGELACEFGVLESGEHDHRRRLLDGSLQVGSSAVQVGALESAGGSPQFLGDTIRADLAQFEELIDADRVGGDVDKGGCVSFGGRGGGLGGRGGRLLCRRRRGSPLAVVVVAVYTTTEAASTRR